MRAGPDVRVIEDPAAACAASIARRLRAVVQRRRTATLAVSGGSSAPPMLAALAECDVPWARVGVWQVDERVAPDGHDDRNAGQLAALGGRHRLMPVTSGDLGAAARRYARTLPERFDVVHLGMGDDGHTASWPPGDPVVESTAKVAIVGPYAGRRRMTLTPRVVNAATGRVVLTWGESKAEALAAWLNGGDADDTDGADANADAARPPIAMLRPARTVVFTDAAATTQLSVGPGAR